MIIKNKNTIIYVLCGITSLIFGLCIYLFLRKETYIAQWIFPGIFPDVEVGMLNNGFVKYYLPDYLWAFSLSCWLHVIFNPRRHGTVISTMVVFLYGLLYEIMQYTGFIKGTGDPLDVLLYLLAGFSVNIIFIYKRRSEK